MMGRCRLFISLIVGFGLGRALTGQEGVDFESLVKAADSARDAGKADQAVGLYEQALHLKPDWKQGWWALGSLLYDANRYAEAREAFLPLTVLDPDKSAGWAMAGLCEFEVGNYKDALPHLQKGIKLALPPGLYDVAQYHIELILIRMADFQPALDMISREATQGRASPKLMEAMGMGALRMPVLPQNIPPSDHHLVMAVGQAMCDAAASRGKEAISEFETILVKYPEHSELNYLEGLVLLQSDPDKALDAFKRELVLSPRHTQVLISIASEYLKRNEYRTALTYAERAVASNPGYFAAHAMLGKVLMEGEIDSSRGIKELETAEVMAPGNPQTHLALASAYAKAGRKSDAAAQRAEFLKIRKRIDASASGPT